LGWLLVSKWSKQITSCPSKLLCHESDTFPHLQSYVRNCQQTLIQSLQKSHHLETNSASDGGFPLQCCSSCNYWVINIIACDLWQANEREVCGMCARPSPMNFFLWPFPS
jgi:hypothetical protein